LTTGSSTRGLPTAGHMSQQQRASCNKENWYVTNITTNTKEIMFLLRVVC